LNLSLLETFIGNSFPLFFVLFTVVIEGPPVRALHEEGCQPCPSAENSHNSSFIPVFLFAGMVPLLSNSCDRVLLFPCNSSGEGRPSGSFLFLTLLSGSALVPFFSFPLASTGFFPGRNQTCFPIFGHWSTLFSPQEAFGSIIFLSAFSVLPFTRYFPLG